MHAYREILLESIKFEEAVMSDYYKLKNQPLMLVLAELRFSPVLQIKELIPKLHDSLRKIYPLIEKTAAQSINVKSGAIEVSHQEQWLFFSADKTSVVYISQDRMFFVTSLYDRFDGFRDRFQYILEKMNEVIEPSLIMRVGLRYSDLILLDDNNTVDKFFSEVFFRSKCLDNSLGKAKQNTVELAYEVNGSPLVVKAVYGITDLFLTPDLQQIPINVNKPKGSSERVVLDLDHYNELTAGPVEFIVEDAIRILDELHEPSRKAFWDMTSEYAKEVWK
jgi:uncharacterized protein (TIGR04255 family)